MAQTPDPQKLALAQAIATNGSAGADAFKSQQADLASQKNQALGVAAQRAGIINAPEAYLKQQAAMVAQPYDTAAHTSTTNHNALGAYTGALQNAHNNYLSELQAAAPLAQAQVDREGGANSLSQMLQLLNAQRADQQFQWQKQDRNEKRSLAAEEKSQTKAQQDALSAISSHPNQALGTAASNIISSAQSLPEALSYLGSDQGKKDLKKLGVTSDSELRQLLTQYYDPKTWIAQNSVATPRPEGY